MWQFLGEQIFSLCTHFQIGLAPFSDSLDLWGAEARELNQVSEALTCLFFFYHRLNMFCDPYETVTMFIKRVRRWMWTPENLTKK
jgi:hypothetical protein